MGIDKLRAEVRRHTQRTKVLGILGEILFSGQKAANEASVVGDVMTPEQARRVQQALMVISTVHGEIATKHLDYINAAGDGSEAQ